MQFAPVQHLSPLVPIRPRLGLPGTPAGLELVELSLHALLVVRHILVASGDHDIGLGAVEPFGEFSDAVLDRVLVPQPPHLGHILGRELVLLGAHVDGRHVLGLHSRSCGDGPVGSLLGSLGVLDRGRGLKERGHVGAPPRIALGQKLEGRVIHRGLGRRRVEDDDVLTQFVTRGVGVPAEEGRVWGDVEGALGPVRRGFCSSLLHRRGRAREGGQCRPA